MTSPIHSTSTIASSPEMSEPVDENGLSADAPWVLGILLALAAAAMLIRRRLAGFTKRASANRAVRVIETTRLGDQTRVSVIHFRGRELLVAHGMHGVALLADRDMDGLPSPG